MVRSQQSGILNNAYCHKKAISIENPYGHGKALFSINFNVAATALFPMNFTVVAMAKPYSLQPSWSRQSPIPYELHRRGKALFLTTFMVTAKPDSLWTSPSRRSPIPYELHHGGKTYSLQPSRSRQSPINAIYIYIYKRYIYNIFSI